MNDTDFEQIFDAGILQLEKALLNLRYWSHKLLSITLGQATEPKCTRSKYGCCWNAKGNVPAKGPYGQGCGGITLVIFFAHQFAL